MTFFQGHPEYDLSSLMKEYKREVLRYLAGELDAPPAYPDRYFSKQAKEIVERFISEAKQAVARNEPLPGLLEDELQPLLDNTWGDTAKAVVNNWLGLVYKLTNLDRKLLFMEDIDPDDPLGMKP